jgi:NAD-dependent DNA ligase
MNKNQLTMAVTGGVGAAVALVFFALVFMNGSTIDQRKQEVADLQNKCSALNGVSRDKTIAEDIKEIDGMGDISAKTLKDTLSLPETIALIEDFKSFGLNMKNLTEKADDRFKGMTFVLTGTLSKFGRREAQEIIEKNGGEVVSSVSKNTSLVLAGSDAGSKLTKAKVLNIKVITEEEFINLINK